MRRRMFALCHRRMWLSRCPNRADVRGQPNLSLDALRDGPCCRPNAVAGAGICVVAHASKSTALYRE